MDVEPAGATYVAAVDMTYKKRAVSTGVGASIALIVVRLLMIWFAPAVWTGWVTVIVAVGLLATLVGMVFALVAARQRR